MNKQLAAALEDLADDLPGVKPKDLSEVIDMACHEFLLRWRYLQYLERVVPRPERCPDCSRTTQLLPIHYPGKLAFYDIGHAPRCKQYKQDADKAYKFRFERLPLPRSWDPLVAPIESLWDEWLRIVDQPDHEKRLEAWIKKNIGSDGKPTKAANEQMAAFHKQERERKAKGLRKDWLGIGPTGRDD